MFGRKLIPLSTLLLLAACGRYDGGSVTAQHPSGLVQQVDLEGNANKAADVLAKEEAERLVRAQAERDRLAAAQTARDKHAAKAAATKAAEDEAAADAAAEAAAIAAGEAAAEAVAEVPGEIVPEVVPEADAAADQNPEVAAEGSVAALLAEEASLAAEEPTVEEPAVEAPAVEEPAVEEPAVEEPAVEEPAVEEPVVEEAVVELLAVVETTEPAVEPAEAVPAAEDGATGVLPPTWMPGSVPPCDPNDLAATPLRELSLKQTFGTGDEARAMLRSTGGDEFVVQKGSVVGPDGARVVRVAPGEVLLAVIQFDMGGQPVLVQQSLRMDAPR